ncbi:beta-N-acetylhexosaminidase [Rufibacter quisquiliarum]|uniref:beta-N-acetylhexosaminidase n=1 Tax=Rufibacter quisquiliarum TaxID=1549639 RepID=UPI001FE3C3B5|nr:family 20 glycosylhydrolase [Rufibacter quisquiliarum]
MQVIRRKWVRSPYWLAACLLLFFSGCAPQTSSVPAGAAQSLALIPLPAKVVKRNEAFLVNGKTAVVVETTLPEVNQIADYLTSVLGQQLGKELPLKRQGQRGRGNYIALRLNPDLEVGPEAYKIQITRGKVECVAKTPAGLFWAAQTLRQLTYLHAPANQIWLPGGEIQDEPAYKWRGLLLDVSRHFMSKEFIKRYIDLLALYKLNQLHLHLTDDQGWRIEIKKYPALTQKGAWRTEPNGTQHGGFYTQADIREIVAYARARYITVVPEIDAPGHVQAALAAYPELSCTGGPFEVATAAGVHPDILCAGNEKTYAFLKDVLTEVAALFPGQYLHIGGDEAPKERWRVCAKCQGRIRAENLPDEEALQGYFTKRVSDMLTNLHKVPVAWDEVLKGGAPSGTRVQVWHGQKQLKEALQLGLPAITSFRSFFYFDLNSGITNLEKVYQAPVSPSTLSKEEQRLLLGAEAALWTEGVPQERVDEMVFPRLLAFSENVWHGKTTQPDLFADFHRRLQQHYPYLDKVGVDYGFETWPVQFVPTYTPASQTFALSLQPGLQNVSLYYSLNGSEPTLSSQKYEGNPILFSTSTTVKVAPYKNGKKLGETAKASFEKHLALYKRAGLKYGYHPVYAAGGEMALTDGILGGEDYRKGFWQGVEKENLEATLDLEKEIPLQEISIAFLQDVNSWIFLPTKVAFYVAGSDQVFKEVPVATAGQSGKTEKPYRLVFSAQGKGKPVRYVKVVAVNRRVCPPGHPGAGGAAYIMADELIVK